MKHGGWYGPHRKNSPDYGMMLLPIVFGLVVFGPFALMLLLAFIEWFVFILTGYKLNFTERM